ncbi:hypothetical protein JI57_04645 [Psychromonas sp. PRT-SC03]|nr:hypothetical protein JI57_04645 [Psychromonas sp. PRT-SC03]
MIIDKSEANILVAGGTIILSNQIISDERRIETMKLIRSWTNKGSDVLTIQNEVKKRVIGKQEFSDA